MNIKLDLPKVTDLRPRLTVIGVGGAGSNAVNNMIVSGLSGVEFVVANTDAQSLANSSAEHRVQLGVALTEGLGAGAKPEIGQAAAEEAIEEIRAQVAGSHMVFIAAGMGGGTGTGAASVIARVARECGALTVGVVTKPFHFEGSRRMRAAEAGIAGLRPNVDTLIVIPNQNLFRVANERTTFAEAFVLADQVLYSGIACIVDLIIKEGLINLDFADVRTIMSGMGTAMMGTGEAAGEQRAIRAAEEAISNPLLDDISLKGARGLLVSITGNRDLTLYEVDEAATRVRQEVDPEANIIVGANFDDTIGDRLRVSIVASGMERLAEAGVHGAPNYIFEQQRQPHVQPTISLQATAASASASPGMAFATETFAVHPQAPAPPQPAHLEPRQPSQTAQWLPPPVAMPSAPMQFETQQARGQPQQPWTSSHGAVFEEARPSLSAAPSGALEPQFEQLAPEPADFTAEPPKEVRRGNRRLPEVDDFPVVGQREYRAKSEQYSDNPSSAAPSVLTRTSAPPRKLGFFERLTGARREPKAPAPVKGIPQPPRGAPRDVAPAPQGQRQAPRTENRQPSPLGNEEPDLPVFFGQDKKSR